ncbi:protein S40-7-like isoform X2 [Magnolia sinica]|uniref:protein S40-7-like isoform X2 n=1 Tax=Magnolia sinica TaxID=86752 RepID=UPI0026580B62|nr:protein S40-7-like isoform X2 [Magnolia sinica]
MEDLHKNLSSSSSAIRFLGLLKQPDSDLTPLELDEIDVVWSSTTTPSELSDSPTTDNSTETFSPVRSMAHNSASNIHRPFRPDKFGLSAVLSDDPAPLLQRKPSLNPSLSAATAARTIPPVPVPRSDESSGPGSGKFHQSAPVDVPIWPKGNSASANLSLFDEDDEEIDDEMLPPHEIVARSHLTTFSVFEGLGRTLKGRDLRRVRNAIWQKTGLIIL